MPRLSMSLSRFPRASALAAAVSVVLLASACQPCECEPEADGVLVQANDSVVIEPASAAGTATTVVVDSVVIEPGAARRTVRVYPR